jgi:hypothetical protein
MAAEAMSYQDSPKGSHRKNNELVPRCRHQGQCSIREHGGKQRMPSHYVRVFKRPVSSGPRWQVSHAHFVMLSTNSEIRISAKYRWLFGLLLQACYF